MEIRNLGGPVPQELRQRGGADQPVLQLTKTGRSRATASLSAFDPQRLLSRGGSAAVYVPGEPLSASAAVGAVIEGEKRVDGRSRADDAKTESLDRR